MEEEKGQKPFDIQEFIKKNWLFAGLICISLVLLTVGIFQYLSTKKENIEIVSSQNVKGEATSANLVSVDIEGKVMKPGVYKLPEGSRIQDALIASGGLDSNADRDYVAKKLNLAQKLTDEAKVYIPAVGEVPTGTTGSNSTASTVLSSNSSFININSASSDELDKLPKVGSVTAQKIISGRPYVKIEDLVSKKILSQKTFDGLKDMITAE